MQRSLILKIILYFLIIVVIVQSLSHVWLFATPWAATHQASLSFTVSRSLLRLMSIESGMPSNHLILCHPLLLLPLIFPNTRVFSNKSGLHIRWPKYWPASVLPMNIQGWFPLGLTGLISLSKGLSRVFSSNYSVLSLLYGPSIMSVHDYWKNYNLEYIDLCQQSDVCG